MIEIKISQGAKPGMGGKLPGAEVTDEIALIRQIKPGQTATSPARHPDISSANELSDKIGQLREMTEGKPIALKMVGGHIERDLTTKYWMKTSDDKLLIKSVINVIRWKECTGRSKVKTAGLQLLTAWHH